MAQKNVKTLAIGFVVCFALSLILWVYWNQSKKNLALLISDNVHQLARILNTIDETCGILSFEHKRNYIDFLNVISFEGSEVGPLNLKYPDRWQGPYLKDNPTIQEKYYEVVRTKHGYFVVPGDGVKLPNNLQIGQDVIFDETTNIAKFIQPGGVLNLYGFPLAAQIAYGKSKWTEKQKSFEEKMLVERLKQM